MTTRNPSPKQAATSIKLQRASSQPENPFASLIPDQHIAIVPSFTLESGVTLRNVPVAYSKKGNLSPSGDNALVICHALSGSADVADWWGPLMGGSGRAFDVTRFFVVCLNSLGSPYGTASPVTNADGNPEKGTYGPEFPLTTIRDDVKLVLDDLGVRQVAAAIGGSMGGMLVLEYAYFGKDYVRAIVPIATSSRHSAWGISWGEAQRQSIYCDPKYEDGYYSFEDPPQTGLGAARMQALLTYRSRNSFESRFGRNVPDPSKAQNINSPQEPSTPANEHLVIHNDGHKFSGIRRPQSSNGTTPPRTPSESATIFPNEQPPPLTDPQFHGATAVSMPTTPLTSTDRKRPRSTYFSAQSYLRYQGQKFVKRFDSNCYIAITRKLDTHDVSKHLLPSSTTTSVESTPAGATASDVAAALSLIEQPALVIGIESDGLFTFAEQQELAANIPNARLRKIDSPEGHDAFLLQFEQVNRHIVEFFREVLPEIMERKASNAEDFEKNGKGEVGQLVKNSTFGEAEVGDITAW